MLELWFEVTLQPFNIRGFSNITTIKYILFCCSINPHFHNLHQSYFIAAKYRTLQKAKQATGQTDTRLTKSEFRDLIYTICDEIPGDNTFEFFVDFVESCVEVRVYL